VLGVVDSDRVVYYREPVKRRTFQSEFDLAKVTSLPRVDVLMVYQDAPGDLIKAAVDAGAKGSVIATAGAGATSGTQGVGLQYAADKHIPVVITTRTGSGRIAPFRGRGAPAQGSSAPDRDQPSPFAYRVAGEDLMPVKARLLLMLALTETSSAADIQRIFSEY
jgi:L-asparaginase/Glu-tRNA(Gln) amidotransferase subunit D